MMSHVGLWIVLLAFQSVQHLGASAAVEVGPAEHVWQHSIVVNRGSKQQQDAKLSEPTSSPRSRPERNKDSRDDLPPDRYSEQQLSGCDFGGRKLRVAVSQQPPLVNCVQNLYGDWLCNGSNIEVISLLEERLNFQAEWVVLTSASSSQVLSSPRSRKQQSNWLFGRSLPVLTSRDQQLSLEEAESRRELGMMTNHTGVLAMVASGRAWLSANGVLKTPSRSSENLLLSEPFDSFKFHFLLSKSVREHDHIFIKPFSTQTWLTIFLSSVLIVPIFYLLNSTSAYYLLREDPFLRRISLFSCFRYRLKRALCILFCWPCNCWTRRKLRRVDKERRLNKRKELAQDNNSNKPTGGEEKPNMTSDYSTEGSTSSSSTNLSFDAQVDRMLALSSSSFAKRSGSGKNLSASQVRELVVRELRLKRLMRSQWTREKRRAQRRGKRERKSGFFRLAYCAWYVIGSLANQGGEEEDLPRANSTRILIAFWWLYQIVIFSFHSGSLTAILTFPKQSDFIQTLDDFLALDVSEKAALRLWLDGTSELAELLGHPDNLKKSDLQLLVNESFSGLYPIKRVDFQRHRQRVLDEVQTGRSAYLEEKSTINLLITQEYFDQQRKSCLFKSSKHPIGVEPMSLVLSDRFEPQCIRVINQMLSRVLQSGLAQKWRRKYDAPGNDCLNTVVINAGDVEKIKLKHVMLAFWLLMAGLIAGAILLILEVVWLFTAEFDEDDDEEDEDDESGSDESDYSSNDDKWQDISSRLPVPSSPRLRLGFRANSMSPENGRTRPLRSLTLKRGSDEGAESRSSAESGLRRAKSPRLPAKEVGGRAKVSDKRNKRLRRTMELMKRLQEGKIYSEFFSKASGNVQNRARRASQAIVSTLPLARKKFATPEKRTTHLTPHSSSSSPGPIRRDPARGIAGNKVAPQAGRLYE